MGKILLTVFWTLQFSVLAQPLELAGVTVVPHLQSKELRYRQEPDWSLGALVQVYLRNAGSSVLTPEATADARVRGTTPESLLKSGQWAWHDFPSAWSNQSLSLPPGALTVWTWNGKRSEWGLGTNATLEIRTGENRMVESFSVEIASPGAWLSAITFLGNETNPIPDHFIFHVANEQEKSLRLDKCRLWLPASAASSRALIAQPWLTEVEAFPANQTIPPHDRGGAVCRTGPLPLSYAVLQVVCSDPNGRPMTLWGQVRIKRECFDISGGWVASSVKHRSALTFEPFLKTLRSLHINTAHIGTVKGYTDDPELYSRYPLKYFNRLQPFEKFDTDTVLPRIHAVEFLGEPQYGGGRPVPPMQVWRALMPYRFTRLPTTVTHSEERIWRFYAGLSDYPHYDAYRVSAPSPDVWSRYERWGGERIRWGAPLETIGDMTRSLRELNRPAPVACWSQGAHEGWERYGGRQRTSPTPDELRAQAYHALAARITSLYWFNLSLKSLLKFPDLMEPIRRVDREIRLLEDFYLEGDAYAYERRTRDGQPDWDLSTVAGPQGGVCFALDLAYAPDGEKRVFKFGPPRRANLEFRLPGYLREPKEVTRVDADGVGLVKFESTACGIRLEESCGPVNVFVVSPRGGLCPELAARRKALVAFEESFGFDPANKPGDLEQLRRILNP